MRSRYSLNLDSRHAPKPATHAGAGTNESSPKHTKVFTVENEAHLLRSLERCSIPTWEAACQFRKTGNTEHLPAIVVGIIERYTARDLRPMLKNPSDSLRLVEDLGQRSRAVYLSMIPTTI